MNMQLRNRVFANDRLLKAIVILLVNRDPDLMVELEAIFNRSMEVSRKLKVASSGEWEDLRNELHLIRTLSAAEEEPVH